MENGWPIAAGRVSAGGALALAFTNSGRPKLKTLLPNSWVERANYEVCGPDGPTGTLGL